MSAAPEAARWRRLAAWAAAAGALWAAALLAAAAWWAGAEVRTLFEPAGLALWISTAAALAANHLLRFARWHWMLRVEGHAVPGWRSLRVFLAGLALLPTPGKAGVVVRSLLLQRDGVPVNVSLAMHFSERLFDFLGLVALAALLLGHAMEAARWPAAVAAGLLAVLAVRVAPSACRSITARATAWPRLQRLLRWLQQFLDHAAELVAGWRFWPYLILGTAANVVTGLLLWWVFLELGGALAWTDATAVVAIAHLTGSLSLLPGGIGGFEAAMLAQLALLGAGAGAALAATALVRVATLWGSVAIGLPLLAWELRGGSGVRPPGVEGARAR